MDLSDVLKIAGAVAFVAAGFVVGTVAGLVTVGVLLCVAGWLVEK